MKSIVIISDSHGNVKNLEKLLPIFNENDFVVHLGDGIGDMRFLLRQEETLYNKFYGCAGNCDFSSPYPLEGIFSVENVDIFYCHGHNYRVKSTLAELAQRAKQKGCQVALYGHTHTPNITEIDGVTLINPGSLRYPLHQGGSYCYMVIHGEKITPVIVGNSLNESK